MPWALELYFLCQQYNKLPTAGSILDEEPYLLYAMDNSIAGYRFSEKALKSYTADDHNTKRMINILTMITNGVNKEYFKKQLRLMCGTAVFDGDELNIEQLEASGLESSIGEICQYIT